MTEIQYTSVSKMKKDARFGRSKTRKLLEDETLRWEKFNIGGMNGSVNTNILHSKSTISPATGSNSQPLMTVKLGMINRTGSVVASGEKFLLEIERKGISWGLYPSITIDGVPRIDADQEHLALFRLSLSIDWKVFIRIDDGWLVLIHMGGVLGASKFRLYIMEKAPLNPKVAEELGGRQIDGKLSLLGILNEGEMWISRRQSNLLDEQNTNTVALVAVIARNIILCDGLYK